MGQKEKCDTVIIFSKTMLCNSTPSLLPKVGYFAELVVQEWPALVGIGADV